MKKNLIFLLVLVLMIPCFSLFVNAAEPVNVAEGKSYTVDITDGTAGYGIPVPDDGSGFGDGIDAYRQRLTDGVIAAEDGGLTGQIGAQSTATAIYVIDLGSVVSGISKFNMDMYSIPSWGVGDAISVEYAVSTNGTDYTTVGTVLRADAVSKGNTDFIGHDYILTLAAPQSARYVRMTASATNYVWSSEMQVFADNTIPDVSNEDTSSVSNTESSEETVNSTVNTNSDIVNTSDYNDYIPFGVVAVLAIGCIYFVARKRIHSN